MLHRMGWQETPYQSARKQASVPIMLPLIPFREPEGFDIVALHFGATERNEWCLLLLISFNEDNGAPSAIRIASEYRVTKVDCWYLLNIQIYKLRV